MSDDAIHFEVPGIPTAQARHRVFHNKATGRVQSYTPGSTKAAQENVRYAAIQALPQGHTPWDTPLRLDCTFYFPWPESKRFKSFAHLCRFRERNDPTGDRTLKRLFPCSKPDWDNLVKLVMDSLKGIVWTDDCRVCNGAFSKQYTLDVPRTVITITKLWPQDSEIYLQLEALSETPANHQA